MTNVSTPSLCYCNRFYNASTSQIDPLAPRSRLPGCASRVAVLCARASCRPRDETQTARHHPFALTWAAREWAHVASHALRHAFCAVACDLEGLAQSSCTPRGQVPWPLLEVTFERSNRPSKLRQEFRSRLRRGRNRVVGPRPAAPAAPAPVCATRFAIVAPHRFHACVVACRSLQGSVWLATRRCRSHRRRPDRGSSHRWPSANILCRSRGRNRRGE